MSNHQVEEVKMTNVVCNLVTHQTKVIEALCLNPKCSENTTLCSKCLINTHLQCREQVIHLDVIPKQLMELQQLQFDVLMLQEIINNQFKELLSKIQQFLVPISIYQNTPNLTNLNEIGLLLRANQKQTLLQLIDASKIQIRALLDNNVEQKQHEPKQMINKVEQQEERSKKSDQDWYGEGRSLYQQDKYSEAIPCFDQAIQINPKHENSWYYKGRSLYLQRKYSEAIPCFDQAIQINPKHEDSWHYKGQSLYWQGKYSEAIPCFDQAIQINPNSYMNWYSKGQSLHQQGKYSEAIPCFDQAIQINPNSYMNWYYKGLQLSKLGRFEEAIKCYEQSLKLDSTKAKQALEEAKEALKGNQK